MGIAAVGNQFFIIWEGNYVSGVSFVYDTEGARVESGTVLDSPNPISVSRSAAWQTYSATSFDGENFLCIFEDWRTGAPSYASNLYGVRVSPQGIPLESSAFAVKTPGTCRLPPSSPIRIRPPKDTGRASTLRGSRRRRTWSPP